MRKIIKFLFIFFIYDSFANDLLFDTNVLCNNDNLHSDSNTTVMIPVFQATEHTCESGYFLPANSSDCVACPTGYTCPGGTFDFNPYDAQGLNTNQMFTASVNNMCAKNVLNESNNFTTLVPVFRIITYTCESGYFLPANSSACVACPTGYTCPGGTFTANSTMVQGIEIKEIFNGETTNVCSANFLNAKNNIAHVVAIYKPKTVSLTYYDRDTVVSTSSCEYDTSIVLPDVIPERPGYIFAGWAVEK